MRNNNVFMIGGLVSFVYFIIKFIEMRFIEKESKPLKVLIKDSLVVYFSVVIGYFVLEQLKPVIQEAGGGGELNAAVFTDNPNF